MSKKTEEQQLKDFEDQLSVLKDSIELFEIGKKHQVKSIAASIHVFLQPKSSNRALIREMREYYKLPIFYIAEDDEGIRFTLDDLLDRPWFSTSPVFEKGDGLLLTARELISVLRDQDSVAHQDDKLDKRVSLARNLKVEDNNWADAAILTLGKWTVQDADDVLAQIYKLKT
jgi:hypothetical protein